MKGILNNLGGRKFLTAVSMSMLIGLNEGLGLGMEEETLTQMCMILGSWILGESVIDASSAFKKEGK
tara:strand:- start:3816 stop:4016 length:201 start_codon:yes stop_codon:yes gene_type:complete